MSVLWPEKFFSQTTTIITSPALSHVSASALKTEVAGTETVVGIMTETRKMSSLDFDPMSHGSESDDKPSVKEIKAKKGTSQRMETTCRNSDGGM